MINNDVSTNGPRYVQTLTPREHQEARASVERPYDNLTYHHIDQTVDGLDVQEVDARPSSILKDICNIAIGVATIAAAVIVPTGGPFLLGIGVHAVVNSISNAGDGKWYWQRSDGLVAGVTVGLAAYFAVLGRVIPATFATLAGLAVGTDALSGAIDQVGKTTDSVGSLVQRALVGPHSPLWGILPWVIFAVVIWKFVAKREQHTDGQSVDGAVDDMNDPLFDV